MKPGTGWQSRTKHNSAHRTFWFLRILTLLPLLLTPLTNATAASKNQTSIPSEQAQSLLERLSPEDRIGQLFLVTFQGNQLETDPTFSELISRYHIGGVILRRENDNFGPENTLEATIDLNRQIQLTRWNAANDEQVEESGDANAQIFIPLFIGISQEGDAFPNDQILHDLTPLPNSLALGATWNPQLAQEVGRVIGEELKNLGINLLLGPSLDVLQNPNWQGAQDLGVRAFGGDPFWVGQMGQAYIAGVHQGSQNKIAVVAKHFPGYGTSDRLPESEVATVRRSLFDLQNLDLKPFFKVTGQAASPDVTTDGLLTAHLRFQQFDNSLSGTTRPISFDPQALALLINLPEIRTWREDGGILVADDLGGDVIRQYYALNSQVFDPRRVALNAFLAGNDQLIISDFTSPEFPDPLTAASRTLDFFTQKYREETAFAQRVDEAVLRILTLKYHMYPTFSLDEVLPVVEPPAVFGKSSQVTSEIARQAATLVNPTQAELDDLVPDPPNGNDRIVIITDIRFSKQCSTCSEQVLVGLRDLENIVVRRYGPLGSGLIRPNNISSYALSDLVELLKSRNQNDSLLANDLQLANWIVFLLLDDLSPERAYQTLEQFLAEKAELFQQKRLILFALGAPYYLDATDLTKLTAFYALYSKTPQFVDMAAYLLFRELPAQGALPISVQGVNYTLADALRPNPQQTILLSLDTGTAANDPLATPQAIAPAEVRVGDAFTVQTSVILDYNGKPVADDTVVEFSFNLNVETSLIQQRALTKGGIARATYVANGSGVLSIRAQSGTAQATPLQIDITFPGGITATPAPTPQPTLTPAPVPQTTLMITPPATAEPPLPVDEGPGEQRPNLTDWVLVIVLTAGSAIGLYRIMALIGQVRWGVRMAFLAFIGGMLAYSYLAFKLPGWEVLTSGSVVRGIWLVTFGGILIGVLVSWLWRSVGPAISKEITAKFPQQPKADSN